MSENIDGLMQELSNTLFWMAVATIGTHGIIGVCLWWLK